MSNQTGTYVIYSEPGGEFYVGSTTNMLTRFINHYSDSRDPLLSHRLLYAEVRNVGGFDHFLLDVVKGTPDHYLEFIRSNLDYTRDHSL